MSTLHPNNGILNIQVSVTGHDQTDRQITFILEKMERTKIPSSPPPPPSSISKITFFFKALQNKIFADSQSQVL